ncbi:MAG: Tex family protein [Candidatus Electryonea clarkiae]|nr:Tex family protein [Candidatus Electryonea clarkiae]MDP8285208.1 Tex family protein [Candidatus Electryonea clarkiae]
MNDIFFRKIAQELNTREQQVQAASGLLKGGATVPFIARYRKEITGSLDEIAITAIRNRLGQLEELEKRKQSILKSLDERELLTDELKSEIDSAETLTVLEDIYLPYRPKRRTRAMIARERGLEPLAELIFKQENIDPVTEAEAYLDLENDVPEVEDALAGARDIIAEWINENQQARAEIRRLFGKKGILTSKVIKGKENEAAKFSDYFEWSEPVEKIPSHRLLAMRRGENEGFLSLQIRPPEDEALQRLKKRFIKKDNAAAEEVLIALKDSYKRLLSLSMETEIRLESKQRADEAAIAVFAENLRELLLAPPLGARRVMAIDPGFRTGCKVVCLDPLGGLRHNVTIYPHTSRQRASDASVKIRDNIELFKTEVIAIGNGTAGRETERFILNLDLPKSIVVILVSESGASIYSASEVAQKEFPDHDITVRGAVSIGRRLMDPLAEMVKIEPRSIGVGQYQYDVDQKALRQSLDDVVVSCVNAVGVSLNTASPELLSYVSGIGPKLAGNIVEYRGNKGSFRSRKSLKSVPGLGPKAFEQAAGFLRIPNAANPLDSSAVHPESYHIVEKMVKDLGCSISDLLNNEQLRKQIKLELYVNDKVGMPTLNDIMSELAKPGRDPREEYELFAYAEGIESVDDLKEGMILPGVVTNVTAFGAFVDIGVHQDGLVHISKLADKFVKNPNDVVKVNQKVQVAVISIDIERKRIGLSTREGDLQN